MKANLNVAVALCSYLSSYKLTSVRVAVPVIIVSTQNELKAEVGFFARKEKMYAKGSAPKMNRVTSAMRAAASESRVAIWLA